MQYKDDQWSQLMFKSEPSPRAEANGCYDINQQRLVIGGGQGLPDYNDTWQYKGGSFLKLNNHAMMQASAGRGMFYNSYTGRPCQITGDGNIYELRSNQWVSLNTPLPNWGGFMHAASSSFDTHSNLLVVFGGWRDTDLVEDTYIWSATTNAWSKMSGEVSPPARNHARLVYIPTQRKHILVGGGDRTHIFDDVWELDLPSQSWRQVNIENPYRIDAHGLVYDVAGDRILCISGVTSWNPWEYATSVMELRFNEIPQQAVHSMWLF